MALTDQDIRLMSSQVLADVPEGGGHMSGQEVIDNVSNNLFPDVSELDRTIGRVSLRKCFPAVMSANRDAFYGANVIIDRLPEDPNVSVTLFSTKSWTDTRDSAVSRMEAYLARGPRFDGYLFDQHIAGQRAIVIVQRQDRELPRVGQTLALVKYSGQANETTQYVRITRVTDVVQTFSASGCAAEFRRRIVTCELSSALERDYLGGIPHCNDDAAVAGADTTLYTTIVADAARYAGMSTLTQAAAMGAYRIKAATIMTQLVPSAQVEMPIVDTPPYQNAALPVPGAAPVTYTTTASWSSTVALNLPGGCLPGSLTVTVGSTTITDDAGILKSAGTEVGSIDYANGIMQLASGSLPGEKSITYTPAAQLLRIPQSMEIAVTAETRSLSYTGMIDPIPQPGTMSVSYLAGGRWYVLSDTGSGALRGGDASYGAGTINTATGLFVVTLGALPDVGSSIIIAWGAACMETSHATRTVKIKKTIELANNVAPASLSLSWVSGGQTRTATAAANGSLSGDATGSVRGKTIVFEPATIPDGTTEITVAYSKLGNVDVDQFSGLTPDNGKLNIQATHTPVIPGSVRIDWVVGSPLPEGNVDTSYQAWLLQEAGIAVGAFSCLAYDDGAGKIMRNGVQVGTIDYATGAVSLDEAVSVNVPIFDDLKATVGGRLAWSSVSYESRTAHYAGGAVNMSYHGQQSPTAENETFVFGQPEIELSLGTGSLVPGSVTLRVGQSTMGDSGTGVLRESTGAGWVTRGTIDYLAGVVALQSLPAGTVNSCTIMSMVTTTGVIAESDYVFRTAAAPLRPGSLSIQYARASGGVQTLTATTTGTISGTGVEGSVDYETGIVRLRFGRYVTAAGNETQPWYNAENVRQDGTIWRPEPVAAGTVRYTAVAYSFIPLDRDILGIDSVRLPTDGRVPIFRAGDVAVVHHTGTVTVTSLATPQTINLGRTRLSRVWIFDEGNNDARVATASYTVDLDAGTVTLTDTSGLIGPLRIEHRIEDMALVSDVQISGDVTLTKPLTHDFPAGSGVSSALVIGDMQARATPPFDQQTWTGVWSDSLIGQATSAEYNDSQYPVVVTNAGAIEERWALIFDSPTQVRVIGESVGQIAVASINSDIAPVNPATGVPYFTIPAAGWGGGWSTGNVLRFNTVAANYPVWIARTVRQGPGFEGGDRFRIQIRGDAN